LIEVQFIGSGDAFGSGGRFQTCVLLHGADRPLLIDCGASSLIAMKRLGIDPSTIKAVVLTHLHGDHFAGIPFLILDGQFSGRTAPLTIAGPPSTRERIDSAMEVLFPGSTKINRRFSVDFVELVDGRAVRVGPAEVTALGVEHASGAPPSQCESNMAGRRSPTPATRNGPMRCARRRKAPICLSLRPISSRNRLSITWIFERFRRTDLSFGADGWF